MERESKSSQVRRVIREANGPLSATEAWDRLRPDGIGIATVYRALKQGVESGDLLEVELPGGPSRFEPKERVHHHHFLCTGCDRAYDIDGCVPGIGALLPANFSMTCHEILLFGICANCAEDA